VHGKSPSYVDRTVSNPGHGNDGICSSSDSENPCGDAEDQATTGQERT